MVHRGLNGSCARMLRLQLPIAWRGLLPKSRTQRTNQQRPFLFFTPLVQRRFFNRVCECRLSRSFGSGSSLSLREIDFVAAHRVDREDVEKSSSRLHFLGFCFIRTSRRRHVDIVPQHVCNMRRFAVGKRSCRDYISLSGNTALLKYTFVLFLDLVSIYASHRW